MKLFERPIAELVVFSVNDVITTSAVEEEEEEEPVAGLGNCFG